MICVPVKKESGKKWRILDTVTGQGLYGSVRIACEQINEEDDCSYVIKIIPFVKGYSERSFKMEVKIQQILARRGLALKVIDYWTCKDRPTGVIVMKVLDMTIEKFLELSPSVEDQENLISAAFQLIKDLHAYGFYHGDLHIGNIMLKKVKPSSAEPYVFHSDIGSFRLYLIDMGKSGSLKHPGKIFRRILTPQDRIDNDVDLLTSEFKTYARKAML